MTFDPEYAKEYLEKLKQGLPERCNWCKRDKRLNKKERLCNSCNDVRLELNTLRKNVEAEQNDRSSERVAPSSRELRVSEYMKEDCIHWGERFESILNSAVDCINLEHYFRDFAERVASDGHMYFKLEYTLDALLTSDQVRVLEYLFWQPSSEEASPDAGRLRTPGSIKRAMASDRRLYLQEIATLEVKSHQELP
jgi:hypothetical protein